MVFLLRVCVSRMSDKKRTGPTDYCRPYELVDGKYSRVGAVVGTKKAYASGRYKIVARVPPGNDGEVDGMGYVWAMWTFHYEEMYARGPGGPGPADDQLLRGNDHPPAWSKSQTYQTCAADYAGPCDNRFACGNSGNCRRNEAPFTMHVHEIDIEVPANPRGGKFKDPADGKWKSDTINFNTWLGDDQDYGADSPYHQEAAQQQNNNQTRGGGASLISRHEAEFRTYEFVWHAGDRVEFYVDGRHLYTSRRYVPTRAGRLVFGPWFGWWGGAANFDTREVLVKRVEITPLPSARDRAWPQQFDSCNPDATDRTICDFNALTGRRCEPDTCVRAGFPTLADTHCTASRAAAIAAMPAAPFGVPKRFG